jgi:hypothetical protein
VRQGQFGICSRNLWMDETDESNLLVRLARGLRLEERLRQAAAGLGHDLAVQAEVLGPGIQKNKDVGEKPGPAAALAAPAAQSGAPHPSAAAPGASILPIGPPAEVPR